MDAPKCRICLQPHWLSVNCKGEPHQQQQNIQREGRRVLKGSTGQPAKPTRTASTERTDPPKPAKAPADRAIAEKAGNGAPKPRRKKKAKKAAKKKSKPPQESTR